MKIKVKTTYIIMCSITVVKTENKDFAIACLKQLIEMWCNCEYYSGMSANELFNQCWETQNFGDICEFYVLERWI